MAGISFDDLIPANAPRQGSGKAPAISFDDLIPQKGEQAPPPGFMVDMGSRRRIPSVDAMGSATGGYEDLPPPPSNAPRDLRQIGTAEDVARASATGLGRGMMAVPTAPQDTYDLISNLLETAMKKGLKFAGALPNAPDQSWGDTFRSTAQENRDLRGQALPRGDDVMRAVESTGPLYQPKTTAGRYAETAASFIPAAVTPAAVLRQGAGQMASNAVRYGVLPGVAAEGAGQLTHEVAPEYEVPARIVAGLVTGGAGAAMGRPTVDRTLQNATRGLTAAHIDQAEALIRDAAQRGVTLTVPEAVQQVTGGATNLGNLQRLVEGQGGMRDIISQRPAQVEAAGRQAFHQFGPAAPSPSQIGPQVGQVAQDTVEGVRGAINNATRPAYQRAEVQRIDPQTFRQVSQDPTFQLGLERVRNDPLIGPTLRHLPDDSIGVIDAVRKELDQTGRNLRSRFNQNGNDFAASIAERGAGNLGQTAERASPDYAAAQAQQAQLRERFLEPLQNGPIGQLARHDVTTQKALSTLFPDNPLPNSQGEIRDAIGALNAQRPAVARQLVRAHAESVFNEATQNLQSGPNGFGGAKFVATLRGNSQQAANLNASIEAIGGRPAVEGFNRFLDVLEATGQRQPMGSTTAFNTVALHDFQSGGRGAMLGEAALTAGTKLPARIKESLQAWRLGRNIDELAGIFSSPDGIARLRQIGNASSAPALAAMIGNLVAIGGRSAKSGQREKRQ